MKKHLLGLLLGLLSITPTVFAQNLELPWSDRCARVVAFGGGDLSNGFTEYSWVSSVWKEVENLMAPLFGKETIKISFEYLQYRTGFSVLSQAEYAADCNAFPEDTDEDMLTIFAKAEARTLTEADFRGPKWIHTVQPMDTEEANCLTLSKINGVVAGCADQWQDGISKEEAVCFKKKTYLRCHIDCMEKIYDHKVKTTPGFCPEVKD